ARLNPGDTQRIVRALEVIDASGMSLLDWQSRPRAPVLDADATIRLVVAPEREPLYRRIDQRLAAMVEQGALAEVEQLARLGLDPALPVMGALGVRPFLDHLEGKVAIDEAVRLAQTETRQYAKRQLTWARGNM